MSGYAFHPEAFADIDQLWEYAGFLSEGSGCRSM